MSKKYSKLTLTWIIQRLNYEKCKEEKDCNMNTHAGRIIIMLDQQTAILAMGERLTWVTVTMRAASRKRILGHENLMTIIRHELPI